MPSLKKFLRSKSKATDGAGKATAPPTQGSNETMNLVSSEEDGLSTSLDVSKLRKAMRAAEAEARKKSSPLPPRDPATSSLHLAPAELWEYVDYDEDTEFQEVRDAEATTTGVDTTSSSEVIPRQDSLDLTDSTQASTMDDHATPTADHYGALGQVLFVSVPPGFISDDDTADAHAVELPALDPGASFSSDRTPTTASGPRPDTPTMDAAAAAADDASTGMVLPPLLPSPSPPPRYAALSPRTVRAAMSLADSDYCSAQTGLPSGSKSRPSTGKFTAEARRLAGLEDLPNAAEVEAQLEMYDAAIRDFTGRELPAAEVVRLYRSEVHSRNW